MNENNNSNSEEISEYRRGYKRGRLQGWDEAKRFFNQQEDNNFELLLTYLRELDIFDSTEKPYLEHTNQNDEIVRDELTLSGLIIFGMDAVIELVNNLKSNTRLVG